MAHHDLKPGTGTVHWGFLDPGLAPILTIDPGDTVHVRSVSGGPQEIPSPDAGFTLHPAMAEIHRDVSAGPGPHILVGPIAIRGAEPGDALRIDILEIALADDWGFNLIRAGRGTLPEDFPFDRLIHLAIDRDHGVVRTPWGMDVPAHPFFGIIATAPGQGRVTSVIPGSFGGNIDCKELIPGASLYLPVEVAGGLVSIGDGHAAQGDGEVCLTAVETGMTGTLRISLLKAAHLALPHAETPTHLIAFGFDEDLDEAVRIALRAMIRLIVARTSLASEAAYRLCSLAADIRVTQTVNVAKGIHILLPRRYIEDSNHASAPVVAAGSKETEA